ELLDGYETLVLIDAVSRGDPPGTVSVIEPAAASGDDPGLLAAMDAHGMDPAAVLAMVSDLGGHLDHVLLVGCEAAQLDEGIGLSDTVAAAVPVAVSVVRELVASRIDAGDIASRIDAGDKETG
ncbi:MAG TPA: hydrogenase maturation protease, partial [Acidimicrobiales bacterium]|nr:hydrogenase maturation protease [Acidimicrobiales bacterium]